MHFWVFYILTNRFFPPLTAIKAQKAPKEPPPSELEENPPSISSEFPADMNPPSLPPIPTPAPPTITETTESSVGTTVPRQQTSVTMVTSNQQDQHNFAEENPPSVPSASSIAPSPQNPTASTSPRQRLTASPAAVASSTIAMSSHVTATALAQPVSTNTSLSLSFTTPGSSSQYPIQISSPSVVVPTLSFSATMSPSYTSNLSSSTTATLLSSLSSVAATHSQQPLTSSFSGVSTSGFASSLPPSSAGTMASGQSLNSYNAPTASTHPAPHTSAGVSSFASSFQAPKSGTMVSMATDGSNVPTQVATTAGMGGTPPAYIQHTTAGATMVQTPVASNVGVSNSTVTSKAATNLAAAHAAAEMVRQQAEASAQIGTFPSQATGPAGVMSGITRPGVPTIPSTLSQPRPAHAGLVVSQAGIPGGNLNATANVGIPLQSGTQTALGAQSVMSMPSTVPPMAASTTVTGMQQQHGGAAVSVASSVSSFTTGSPALPIVPTSVQQPATALPSSISHAPVSQPQPITGPPQPPIPVRNYM